MTDLIRTGWHSACKFSSGTPGVLMKNALALLSLIGCTSDSEISETAGDVLYGEDAGQTMAPSDESAGGEAGDWDDYEPEVEDDLLALKPATTPEYVFVANPDRNTVTRISVPGLAVVTTEVGLNPIGIAVTPDNQTAVSFNMDSNTLSIIDAQTLEVQTVDVRAGRNEMVMSPDGEWVICYFNQASDLSLIHISEPRDGLLSRMPSSA